MTKPKPIYKDDVILAYNKAIIRVIEREQIDAEPIYWVEVWNDKEQKYEDVSPPSQQSKQMALTQATKLWEESLKERGL